MAAQTCHCSPGDVETVELAWCTQDDPVSIKSNETKHNNPTRKSKFHPTSADLKELTSASQWVAHRLESVNTTQEHMQAKFFIQNLHLVQNFLGFARLSAFNYYPQNAEGRVSSASKETEVGDYATCLKSHS